MLFCSVSSLVIDLFLYFVKGIPGLIWRNFFILPSFFDLIHIFLLHFSDQVPLQHLTQEVTTVLRLFEDSKVVLLFAHDGDILQATTQFIYHKFVHLTRIGYSRIEVTINWFCDDLWVRLVIRPCSNSKVFLILDIVILTPFILCVPIPCLNRFLATFLSPNFFIFGILIELYKSPLSQTVFYVIELPFSSLKPGSDDSFKMSGIVNETKEFFRFDWLAFVFLS